MSVLKSEMGIVADRIEKAESTIRKAVDRHRGDGDSEALAMAKAYTEPAVVAARVELRKLDPEACRLIDAAESAEHARERVRKAAAVDPLELTVDRLRKADPSLTEAQATLAAFHDSSYGRQRREQQAA